MIDVWTIIFPKLIHTVPSKHLKNFGRLLFQQKESSNHNYLKSFNLDDNRQMDDSFCKTYLGYGRACLPLLPVRPLITFQIMAKNFATLASQKPKDEKRV